ncbi:MAG: YceG family protein [Acidaminobacteraceae bacterium]
MDKNKHIQMDVFNHRNIYADVFIPIMRRSGFNTGVKITYNIICSKQIGVYLSGKDELDKLILMIKKLKSHNISYQITNDKLDFRPMNSTIQIIKTSFTNYEPNENSIKNIVHNIFLSKEILTFNPDEAKLSIIKDALINTLTSFETSETQVNSSKMINVAVKLIYWINSYLKNILDERTETLDKSTMNSKVIHLGDLSHQDSYYMLLSFNLGFDTLYTTFEDTNISHFSKKLLELGKLTKHTNFDKNALLLTLANDKVKNVAPIHKQVSTPQRKTIKDKAIPIASKTNSPSMGNINFNRPGSSKTSNIAPSNGPVFNSNTTSSSSSRPASPTINATKQSNSSQSRPVSSKLVKKEIQSNIVINHKKFDSDINSLLAPLKDRAGFIGDPSRVNPVYFARYIGTDSDKNVYRNRLFKFDNTLSREFRNYTKFQSPIKIGNYADINKKTNLIWQEFSELSLDKLDDFIKFLNGSDVFSFISDENLRNRSSLAIKEVLKIAFHGLDSIPTSKVKNLVIKLIGWLSDHSSTLVNGYSFDKSHNPKIMFYGDIKSHEALYLIFLHYCGMDVIYINSFQDDVFEALDPDELITSVHTLDKVHPLEEFPTSEVMILQQTTAYEASEEISRIVHNDQDGVYKPWQFESYKTMPLTLRTTYDEVFILWDEQARIRTGFKVEKNTIYIPNMFVKISGTQELINEYWNIVSKATSSKLTQFYTKLPFTNIDFSNNEIYAVDTAFENHLTLSFEKLKKHNLYKYSHLSSELQLLIYDKLCMLLDTDILINRNDNDLRLKVVLTVLSLNPELLKLIQSFDFPANIPKLVVYDSDETTFSQADSITMAFLYTLGFDICVLTPTGYNNFEMFIDDKYYSVFKLPNKQFNLELADLKRHSGAKGRGFWASIFG